MTHLWQRATWPSFSWSSSALIETLVSARFEQGKLISWPGDFVHSFELSDLRKDLYQDLIQIKPLNLERIFGWQASLFPTGYAGVKKINVGVFRAHDFSRSSLPYKRIAESVEQFLHWWYEPPVELDPVLRSGIAFYWFLMISPFEAGNFEVACALAEYALQESERTNYRHYDLSLALEDHRDEVEVALAEGLAGDGDISGPLLVFLKNMKEALSSALILAEQQQKVTTFWQKNALLDLNTRQRQALDFLLQNNDSSLTNRFYVSLNKTSRESAKRDLSELLKLGLLSRNNQGRSVNYSLSPKIEALV